MTNTFFFYSIIKYKYKCVRTCHSPIHIHTSHFMYEYSILLTCHNIQLYEIKKLKY